MTQIRSLVHLLPEYYFTNELCLNNTDYLFFSVKPLLQSTAIDNLSSINNNSSNVVNPPDRLTTASNISTKANYANLKYGKILK